MLEAAAARRVLCGVLRAAGRPCSGWGRVWAGELDAVLAGGGGPVAARHDQVGGDLDDGDDDESCGAGGTEDGDGDDVVVVDEVADSGVFVVSGMR